MVAFTALLSAAVAVQAVLASPIRSRTPYAVRESHYLPRRWSHVGRPSTSQRLNLHIGVKQGDFAELERHLYEVSDPDHARYGRHLTHSEVAELVKPKDESLDLIHEWLRENGVDADQLSYSSAKDWIKVSLPVEDVERLLDSKYGVYEHEDGTRVVRTLEWSLPRHLHAHVDTIQPTTSFMRSHALASTALELPPIVPEHYTPPSDPTIAKVCNVSSVTPECFATLYKTDGYEVQSADENSIGFNNFLGEVPIRPDTALFARKYKPNAEKQAWSFPQISIDNGPTQNGSLTYNQSIEGTSKEANLDIQAILGISDPTPITAFSTGGSPPFKPSASTTDNTNEPYLAWLDYVLALEKVPAVISTSYADDEQTVPFDYAQRVCQEFAQLGARGVSLLFSSGDDGVGSNGTCVSNDGKNTTMFTPLFPPSCPYVTAVGATHEFQPEVVAYRAQTLDAEGNVVRSAYSSGGGFGNYFATPKYQKSTVKSYLKKLNGTFDGLYNKTGRAYPDIAAQGQYFAYFWNGTEGVISGTSASTPLMAGIIALVNDALIASGKSPLGFLNPWIYSKGFKGFTDITSGSAVGCETEGFPALGGWDPVTGFGTPIFPELVKLAGGKLPKGNGSHTHY